jgi:hypothetical protein
LKAIVPHSVTCSTGPCKEGVDLSELKDLCDEDVTDAAHDLIVELFQWVKFKKPKGLIMINPAVKVVIARSLSSHLRLRIRFAMGGFADAVARPNFCKVAFFVGVRNVLCMPLPTT